MKKRNIKGSERKEIKKIYNFLPVIIKSLVIFVFAVLTASLVCFVTDIDYDKYYIILLCAAVTAAFLSGFSSSRKIKKKGMIIGIISSLPIVILILTVSLILNGAQMTMLMPVTLASVILTGAVSGSVGVNFGR